jgi:3-oxosteroid 1-dehydrogenase
MAEDYRSNQSRQEEYDLVVAGSGIGGLTAAVTAAIEGDVDVLVLEKAETLGGSSGISGSQLWIPDNHRERAAGIDDSVEAGVEYMTHLTSDFYANREAARHYVENAREAAKYLEDTVGMKLQLIRGMPDYHPGEVAAEEGRYLEPKPLDTEELPGWAELPVSRHLPGGATNDELLTWGGPLTPNVWDWDLMNRRREAGIVTMGAALIGYLLRAGAEHGVDIQAGEGVTDLVVEASRVVGVETSQRTVTATEGVVLATGAYDWNPDLIENFEGTPSQEIVSAAVPTAEGEGLKLAASEGAKLGVYPPIGSAKGFFLAVPGEEFMDEPLYRYCYNVGLPHAFAINAAGERFCDESFYPRQSDEFYDPTGEYDDFPMYMIFDETYRQTYALGNYRPGTEYPDEFLAGKADTLAELAQELSVDPDTFTSTTTRFNRHARGGEDPDFSRGDNEWAKVWCGDPTHEPNPNLGPVEHPPFYAVRLYVGLSSMGNVGLLTDDHGRVLDWDDEPIGDLYATGSVCAPVEWGTGYQSGLQNGRSMTYGYLAGKHVVSK